MSSGGKAERMAHLRNAIAGIEAHSGPAPARAPLKLSVARALDPALGSGLAGDTLHEIAPAQAGDGAAAMGFALALAARFAAAAPDVATVLLISEDFCASETGAPYGPGLAAHGLGLRQLVLARAPDALMDIAHRGLVQLADTEQHGIFEFAAGESQLIVRHNYFGFTAGSADETHRAL